MPTALSPLILLATVALPILCGVRAARLENPLLRWSAVGLAALLAAGISTLTVLSVAGLIVVHSRSAPVPALHVAGTAAQVKRGEALANTFCGACHSRTEALTGGRDVGKDLAVPIGSFVPRTSHRPVSWVTGRTAKSFAPFVTASTLMATG